MNPDLGVFFKEITYLININQQKLETHMRIVINSIQKKFKNLQEAKILQQKFVEYKHKI